MPVILEDTVALVLGTTYPEASNILAEGESELLKDFTVNVVTSVISSSWLKNQKKATTITAAAARRVNLFLAPSELEGSSDLSIFRLFNRSSFEHLFSMSDYIDAVEYAHRLQAEKNIIETNLGLFSKRIWNKSIPIYTQLARGH